MKFERNTSKTKDVKILKFVLAVKNLNVLPTIRPKSLDDKKFDETDFESFFYFSKLDNFRSFNCEKPSLDPPNAEKRSLDLLDTAFGEQKIEQFI